jgi:hypothetical protein
MAQPHDAILAALRAEVATALGMVTRAEHAAGEATSGPLVTMRSHARIRLAAVQRCLSVAEGAVSSCKVNRNG